MDKDILQFENMGIYDLRNYARSIGVLSPTKLKRDQLIAKITAIIHGEQPEQKTTNKGRPPKHRIDQKAKLDYILPDNLFASNDPRYKNYTSSNLSFAHGTVLRGNSNPATTNILYSGYYKPYNESYGFVLKKGYLTDYYKDNTIILTDFAKEHCLREGDFVSGACDYISSKNLMLATSVLTVNNEQQKTDRQNFEVDKTARIEKIDLNVGKQVDFEIIDKICPITKGSRVIANFQNPENTNNTMIEFLNNLASNNIIPFVITIDDQPEDVYQMINQCPDTQLINLEFGMDRQYFLESVETKIKHCLRLVENGYDIALVCYNTNLFASNIKSTAILSKNCTDNVAQVIAQNKLKDIFCLAACLQKGSLTTVFANCDQADLLDLCKTYLLFNADSYDNTDITLNMQTSYTRKLQQIVSKQDFAKIKTFKQNFDQNNIVEQLNNLFD